MGVSLVWLKRDLRLKDHAALHKATQSGSPVLLFYCFEPNVVKDKHTSRRHLRFITQSLEDIAQNIPSGSLYCAYGEILDVLEQINQQVGIDGLYSHQEIGLGLTFDRDKQVSQWCDECDITWLEFPQGAVVRGLKMRTYWDKHWQQVMRDQLYDVDCNQVNWFSGGNHFNRHVDLARFKYEEDAADFQKGGETQAWYVIDSFFDYRGKEYAFSLSSPEKSHKHCSRLSAHLAWGNVSLKQVYQSVLANWKKPQWRRSLVAFASRLHWHCHFIQKFESECEMEFRCVNRAFEGMPRIAGDQFTVRLRAWETGHTGIPMVDACMRSLIKTGYLNFRMRAMLVSFLCHHLELDWRAGVAHLAKLFLDFEPGIHYSQFQMQAGVTGINTIRIYNPVKQGQEKDPEGIFVKKWVPELSNIPAPLVHSPWDLSEMEQLMYGIEIGSDYPSPIINLKESYTKAQALLWHWKKREDVTMESKRILATHVRER
ncbi:cryptochrome/deoxyribodipyrimidine photo-lyase family protein [Pseudoalteromonas luteoviolacea]|uniref:cryptochrome/deoxyribodipyrimidine photo-lyase family protein n=1 Tax=Pseudoalteromonas luteoviolacea TaxID=43657 RepID=UPI001B371884|nr:deoxyribodipyrimidine photo-lyase [Pseudoalteromonas luteoviolacea]MBQ4836659.1 deoxyribodipyrimidine photo-lyase [Pseudoalteromonas luteoviolacea]